MNLTEDQRYFMDILETAGFVRAGQVLPLLRINEPQKELKHAEALLRRLRYLGQLPLSPEGLVCLPALRATPPDREMLLALDVLLALHPDRLLRLSLQPPYKLCFLVQRADGWVDDSAGMPVPVGHEGRSSQLLKAKKKNYIFLLPLEDAAQHQQITLACSHYFILRQGDRLRFYKGGKAGK